MKKALYIVIIVILLGVFGVSAYMVGSYLIENKQQQDMYGDLAAIKDQAKPTTEATEPTEETYDPNAPMETIPIHNEDGILLEYEGLYEMNPDMVGWIKIEGTKLDYPVLHTPHSTDFYLKHDFDGKESARGCIYMREECDIFRPTDNITLYGHNMKDGSMFATLNSYVDKKTWENNSLIFFDNLYEAHVYQIFAVFTTTASVGEGFSYHQMEDAADEAEFTEFIRTCKRLQLYETGITPIYGDKIICLSTCEYSQENGRLVVAAVRIS